MPLPIAAYAMIGDCRTGALVGTDGSIDWLCLPRFDAASTFGALLGDAEHGRWLVAPVGAERCTSRAYLDDTFVLATRWVTDDGEVEVLDLMPRHGRRGDGHGDRRSDVIRRVRGVRGTVRMQQEVRIRFDYASALPWVRQQPEGDGGATALVAVAGPDGLAIRGPRLEPDGHRHTSEFTVRAGETVDLVATWFPAHRTPPAALDVGAAIERTVGWWRDWAAAGDRPEGDGVHPDAVRRSLLVLRALTHEDTGGIVAAATTSLPEDPGGSRNWDYRYVWLRDAALTLEALMLHGYVAEATEWRDWLLRAIAGDPADVQIMYGLAGERRLPEWEVDGLPGHDGARPVRVGNAAYEQYQGDVFGEVMLALDLARRVGIDDDRFSWSLQVALLEHIETRLDRPDNGIWEIRGEPRFFTHSRLMLWAAFDRGVRGVREFGLPGDAEHWAAVRDGLRTEIETRGWNAELGAYTQYYGSDVADASLLWLPQSGFLAPDDPRMLGTVALLESQLLDHGLLRRYRTESGVDGVAGDEAAFLPCSFWLVRQYAESGRLDDATALMDRLVGLANDVGLLSEEVDPVTGAQLGNTPQALSHLALVRAANAIAVARGGGRPDPRRAG